MRSLTRSWNGSEIARELVLGNDHITTQEVMDFMHGEVREYHIARMRNRGSLLGVRIGQIGYVYPSFQIDTMGGRIDPDAARINKRLVVRLGVHGAILWWFSPDTTVAPRPHDMFVNGERTVVGRLASTV